MNMLCIARRRSGGGAEIVQQVFLSGIADVHQVEVIYLDDYGRSKSLLSKMSKILAVVDIIKKGKKKDIIFGMQDTTPIYLAVLSGKINSVRSVGWIHNTWSRRKKDLSKIHILLAPLFYRFVGKFIAVSEGVKQDLMSEFDLPEDIVTSIFNPFDFDHANRLISAGIAEIDKSDYEIMTLGRLEYVKGFDILINAIPKLSNKTAKLLIIGSGSQERSLKLLVSQLGMENRIGFIDFTDNPYKYYTRADLFVMPSRYEGFGRVAVEALYCGTSSILSDCPSGPAEIAENGKYARLVKSEDVNALVEAIDDHLTNPQELKNKAKQFKATINRFEKKKVVDEMIEIMRGKN